MKSLKLAQTPVFRFAITKMISAVRTRRPCLEKVCHPTLSLSLSICLPPANAINISTPGLGKLFPMHGYVCVPCPNCVPRLKAALCWALKIAQKNKRKIKLTLSPIGLLMAPEAFAVIVTCSAAGTKDKHADRTVLTLINY